MSREIDETIPKGKHFGVSDKMFLRFVRSDAPDMWIYDWICMRKAKEGSEKMTGRVRTVN